MKLDLLTKQKVNLEKVTKIISEIDPTIEISRFKSSDKDELIINADDHLTKEQRAAIKDIVKTHAPERDDQEEIDYQEQKDYDTKLTAALLRLGFTLPKR
jgi:G3E family GTPase